MHPTAIKLLSCVKYTNLGICESFLAGHIIHQKCPGCSSVVTAAKGWHRVTFAYETYLGITHELVMARYLS